MHREFERKQSQFGANRSLRCKESEFYPNPKVLNPSKTFDIWGSNRRGARLKFALQISTC